MKLCNEFLETIILSSIWPNSDRLLKFMIILSMWFVAISRHKFLISTPILLLLIYLNEFLVLKEKQDFYVTIYLYFFNLFYFRLILFIYVYSIRYIFYRYLVEYNNYLRPKNISCLILAIKVFNFPSL